MKSLHILIFLLLSAVTHTDSPARPLPTVTAGEGLSSYYFVMMPEKYGQVDGKYIVTTPAYGKAYKLNENGESEVVWEVDGWYAFSTYLSQNGEFLVRMGNWAVGSEPSEEDLAVAFYKNGKLLKSYSTKDLIKNGSSVTPSVSHYVWQSNNANYPLLTWDNKFKLQTIENVVYTFDVETGVLQGQESR